jgi:hypothetical protein
MNFAVRALSEQGNVFVDFSEAENDGIEANKLVDGND